MPQGATSAPEAHSEQEPKVEPTTFNMIESTSLVAVLLTDDLLPRGRNLTIQD